MENEACGFSDFDRGAMRQKMAIFKQGNSVWRGTKNFEWRNFHEFHRGTMRQKMAIFKRGNSVCRGTKNFQISFYLHKRIFRGAMRQKIAIFKGRNSVCRVAKFFQISRCDRKWRFSKRETAFAGVQKIFRSHFIYTKNFQGGDATENRDFQRETQRLQGSNFI